VIRKRDVDAVAPAHLLRVDPQLEELRHPTPRAAIEHPRASEQRGADEHEGSPDQAEIEADHDEREDGEPEEQEARSHAAQHADEDPRVRPAPPALGTGHAPGRQVRESRCAIRRCGRSLAAVSPCGQATAASSPSLRPDAAPPSVASGAHEARGVIGDVASTATPTDADGPCG